jgi:F0F1-type ATP synthase membrane subunit b/b'
MTTTNQEAVEKIIANLRALVRSESAAAVERLQSEIEEAIEKAGKDLKKNLTSKDLKKNLTSSGAEKPAKE